MEVKHLHTEDITAIHPKILLLRGMQQPTIQPAVHFLCPKTALTEKAKQTVI